MNAGERGADLIFAAVASGYSPSDDAATQTNATLAANLRAPVRVGAHQAKARRRRRHRAQLDTRTRLGGDPWDFGEPPLGEETETYLVEIVSGGVVIRSWTTIITAATYAAADQIVDFGAPATSFILRIAQISARFWRRGAPRIDDCDIGLRFAAQGLPVRGLDWGPLRKREVGILMARSA